MSTINNTTYNPNWTFEDPFANTSNQPPTTTSSSSRSPFEPFLRRDEYGQILDEHLGVVAQDPEAYLFIEKMVLYDKDRYLAMLLSEGARLHQSFDINTISTSTDTKANNSQNMSHSSQLQNMMNNNLLEATTTIQDTSYMANTSNTINATSSGGSQLVTRPTTLTTLAKLNSATLNPSTFTSTTMNTLLTNPLIDISQNPSGGGGNHIVI